MNSLEHYCEEFLEKIFYFALKKTGNANDADDLASNISFEIFTSLNRGIEPDDLEAWIWTIARNQWSRWAKKHYYSHETNIIHLEEAENFTKAEDNVEEAIILSEDISLLRRELAFIRSDYRQILISHYIENKSVSEISQELRIPRGTVTTKLRKSRQKLKEGMNMARTFGKRSYSPEQVSFVMSGYPGDKGQPWSIISHLLYKNIFLEAYDNPSTADELALEIGIALPYMEEELEFLVGEELLKKSGQKYETAFPIVSQEEQLNRHRKLLDIATRVTPLIVFYIDSFQKACVRSGISWFGSWQNYDHAKWTLLMRTVDELTIDALSDLPEIDFPLRPDNGKWQITGYEHINFDVPLFVGEHGFMDSENKFDQHDLDWGQYKFHQFESNQCTPEHLTYQEVLTIRKIALGMEEECDQIILDKVTAYGYLRKNETGYMPTICVFAKARSQIEGLFAKVDLEQVVRLREQSVQIFRELHDVTNSVDFSIRGYILEQALKGGWVKYNEDTPKIIGSYLCL